MKTNLKISAYTLTILLALFFIQCEKDQFLTDTGDDLIETRAKPGTDIGNNLSFPVIWADLSQLSLRGEPEMSPVLEGEWWYVWGPDPIDPNSPIYSCPPDPDNEALCADGSVPGEGYDNLVKAYLQKDANNIWQAENFTGGAQQVYVDLIDWGDNLESVDWTTKSQVRTEVVLYKTGVVMNEYSMRHVDGWGISEVHGLATNLYNTPIPGPGVEATVYSDNARLTIQKLNIDRELIADGMLEWVNGVGWTEVNPDDDYINPPIFNSAIHENSGYSAEVNVKGKIIYGYTWNVRKANEGEGDYRVTFSFDVRDNLFTSLNDASIITPDEEVEVLFTESSAGEGGGTPVLLGSENLTYIDVRITARNSGKGSGSGGH